MYEYIEDDMVYWPDSFPEKEKTVFLDIETTGLSRRNSMIYLIGYAFFEEGRWTVDQLFAERLSDELSILNRICEVISGADAVVTFNGDNFDLPFIRSSLKDYNCAEPEIKKQIDLFKLLRPYKEFFGLENAKQSSFERVLGLDRNDDKNGGELIEVYLAYQKDGDPEKKEKLLKHNRYDVTGMLMLPRILGIRNIPGNDAAINNLEADGESIRISLSLRRDMALYFEYRHPDIIFKAEGVNAFLTLPVKEGKTKFFFSDHTNYYYLPELDKAIHKSIAAFTDPSHRKKATKENCYSYEAVETLKDEKNLYRFIRSVIERFVPVSKKK